MSIKYFSLLMLLCIAQQTKPKISYDACLEICSEKYDIHDNNGNFSEQIGEYDLCAIACWQRHGEEYMKRSHTVETEKERRRRTKKEQRTRSLKKVKMTTEHKKLSKIVY